MASANVPKKTGIFYGWWIVTACFFLGMYATGLCLFSFTSFFQPLSVEFGWSYAQISLATSIQGIFLSLEMPVLGLLVDRFGPRKLLITGSLLCCSGFLWLSQISSLPMFYSAVVTFSLGVGACGTAVITPAIMHWFRKRAALATGIVVSGFALGGFTVPVVASLIDTFGWQIAMIALGLGMLVIPLPLSFVVRHKPEPYGYYPDGDIRPPSDHEVEIPKTQPKNGNRYHTFLTNRAFWFITTALLLQFASITAVNVHIMPYLESTGVSRTMASSIPGFLALSNVTGRIAFGWVADRYDKRRVMGLIFAMTALGVLSYSFITDSSFWLVVPFIVGMGLGWGGGVTVTATLLRELFGKDSFGSVFGLLLGIMQIGGIVSPPLAGLVFDTWHNYQAAWFVLSGLLALSVLIMLSTPSGKKFVLNSELTPAIIKNK